MHFDKITKAHFSQHGLWIWYVS